MLLCVVLKHIYSVCMLPSELQNNSLLWLPEHKVPAHTPKVWISNDIFASFLMNKVLFIFSHGISFCNWTSYLLGTYEIRAAVGCYLHMSYLTQISIPTAKVIINTPGLEPRSLQSWAYPMSITQLMSKVSPFSLVPPRSTSLKTGPVEKGSPSIPKWSGVGVHLLRRCSLYLSSLSLAPKALPGLKPKNQCTGPWIPK